MRVHVLQHVPFEGPGRIAAWLAARSAEVTTTRLFEADAALPPAGAFDVLIVLGGPMSANDEAALPWLRQEKRLVAAAILSGKAVLGICLGAQLMAAALGARVYPAQHKEIGWFPVQGCAPQDGSFAFPATAEVFHWHGETFDLPDGAVHLARSAACPPDRPTGHRPAISPGNHARKRGRPAHPLPRRTGAVGLHPDRAGIAGQPPGPVCRAGGAHGQAAVLPDAQHIEIRSCFR